MYVVEETQESCQDSTGHELLSFVVDQSISKVERGSLSDVTPDDVHKTIRDNKENPEEGHHINEHSSNGAHVECRVILSRQRAIECEVYSCHIQEEDVESQQDGYLH